MKKTVLVILMAVCLACSLTACGFDFGLGGATSLVDEILE